MLRFYPIPPLSHRTTGKHLIYQAIFFGGLGPHEVVTVGIPLDHFQRLAGMVRQQLVELGTDLEDFTGMDLDIRSLPLEAAQRLMDHHPGIGQYIALALGTCGEQERPHRCCLPQTHGGHVRLDKLHGVVN